MGQSNLAEKRVLLRPGMEAGSALPRPWPRRPFLIPTPAGLPWPRRLGLELRWWVAERRRHWKEALAAVAVTIAACSLWFLLAIRLA